MKYALLDVWASLFTGACAINNPAVFYADSLDEMADQILAFNPRRELTAIYVSMPPHEDDPESGLPDYRYFGLLSFQYPYGVILAGTPYDRMLKDEEVSASFQIYLRCRLEKVRADGIKFTPVPQNRKA